MTDFYYPYSFIRTPSRKAVSNDTFLGDGDPSSSERAQDHSRYRPGHYTGEIPVTLTTETPLFITDPESKRDLGNGHASYACLEEIPATALKGMLSSAYEIITNSRYRVFSKRQHQKRLGYRSEARASLVPGRVSQEGDIWYVVLYTGTSKIGEDGAAERGDPLYAAWLPVYSERGTVEDAACQKLEHGRRYDRVRIGRYSHGNFDLWSVEEIDGTSLHAITDKARPTGAERTVSGYVVKTGRIFFRKHDERFFFNDPADKEIRLELSADVRRAYEDLIADYIRVHEDGANQPNNRNSVLGEHTKKGSKLAELKDGHFVYVKLDVDLTAKGDGRYTVKGLYPVQIPRELYKAAPWDCLDESLRPAGSIEELSPADRLFGWVSQEGKGAWRGKLRISSASHTGEGSPLEPVPVGGADGRPLAILGAPKPAQARFYLGDPKGLPQQDGLDKERAGYTKQKRLRGRKVYLHHQGKVDPFHPMGDKTNQNRSIRNWIPKGKEFRFTIRFEDLTAEETGALLFLLRLGRLSKERPAFFRLGYGKPLGLGSVQLSADSKGIRIFSGDEMRKRYETLGDVSQTPLIPEQHKELRNRFIDAITGGYRNEFVPEMNEDTLMEGLLKAGRGVPAPVAYSVIDGAPELPSFQWFVQNEKRGGRKGSLPRLGEPLQSYPMEERGPGRGNDPRRDGRDRRGGRR